FLDSDDYWADTNRSKNAGGGFSLIYNNLQTKRLI
ncbi:TPA: glycosyltransferase family 2 protein, partial [Neisseria meningitidis]